MEMELDGKRMFLLITFGDFCNLEVKKLTFHQEFFNSLKRRICFGLAWVFFPVIWESFYGLFDKIDTEIGLEKVFELICGKLKIFIRSNIFLQLKKNVY